MEESEENSLLSLVKSIEPDGESIELNEKTREHLNRYINERRK